MTTRARAALPMLASLILLAASPLPAQGKEFILTLTGDSIITQRMSPFEKDPRFAGVLQAVREGHARFTNVEMLFHDFEPPAAAQSGGTWMAAPPVMLHELQWIGFNLLGGANNHSLDYSIEGLMIHLGHLKKAGAVFSGIGADLGEARAPAYLETPAGRVALISCASTFPPGSNAGSSRPDLRGRPGLSPLRFRTIYRVDGAAFETLKKMRQDLRLRSAGGFADAAESGNRLSVLGSTFELADKPEVVTEPEPRDLEAILDSIRDARRGAEYVVVSIHAHEGAPGNREIPAQFLTTFARAAVDAGADVFAGHGPHVLRGLEMYKGKPIFYSLANFIFQNDTVARLPADMYEQFGLGPRNTPADLMDARYEGGKRGFVTDPPIFDSVIAKVVFRARKAAEIVVTPITLGFGRSRAQRGRPEIASAEDGRRILEKFRQLSKLDVRIEDGKGVLRFP